MKKIPELIKFLAHEFLEFPPIKQWMDEHPKIRRQLTERLTTKQFTGLPLTLLTALFLYSVFLFLGVAQDYLAHDPLILADIRVANLLYALRSNTMLHFFYFVTLFAESTTVIILGVVFATILWFSRQRIHAAALWFTLVAGEGVTFLGKQIFQRARPDMFMRAITEDSFSFPSGHATSVVLFYGFLAYLVVRHYTSLKARLATFFSLSVLIVLVDLSRLYLGVHFLSDVVAGNLVGFSALFLSIGLTEWLIALRPDFKPTKTKLPQIFSVLALAVGIAASIYLFATPPVANGKPTVNQKIKFEEIMALFGDQRLPRFTEDIIGGEQEPTNLIIVSPEECFVENITSSDWILAEGVTMRTTRRLAKTAIMNQAYPAAPMTPSFFNEKPNDYGFEKQTDRNSVRARHHARFWKTIYETPLGRVYVGTISLDTGLKWGITHTIAPDIDTERDSFVADLQQAGVVAQEKLVPFVAPTLGKNFSGDQFFTNGKTSMLVLNACAQ